MNDQVPELEQAAAPPPPAPPPAKHVDALRRWTLVIFVLGVALFGWTLIADRLTPYTADASVRTYVIRVVPEV